MTNGSIIYDEMKQKKKKKKAALFFHFLQIAAVLEIKYILFI